MTMLQNGEWLKANAPGEGNPVNGDSGKPAPTFSSLSKPKPQGDGESDNVPKTTNLPEAKSNDPDGDN
jgi:hypothetical protein